jgi:hypothetical protein
METANAFSHQKIGVHDRTYALVREFTYRTSAELAAKINPYILSGEQIHKALSKLHAQGRVVKCHRRRCTVTNKMASVWATW